MYSLRMPPLHPKLREQLVELRTELDARGELLASDRLNLYYRIFQQRFGPEVLQGFDGDALLNVLKEFGRDGLPYWLEFKNDDEFPERFGSIAGGSALKYGVYRRRETGAWMTGSPRGQEEISKVAALDIARRHRDQLFAACHVLSSFDEAAPEPFSSNNYARLQRELSRVAPDVEDTSWGHKYLSLIFPEALDDFHVLAYQQFNLIKLLQLPSLQAGRYVNASYFQLLRAELGWPMNHLTTVLYRRHWPPHSYWRIGTTDDEGRSFWDEMRERGDIAIGWDFIGDLTEANEREDGLKEHVRGLLTDYKWSSPQAIGRAAKEITHFCWSIDLGDYVIACDGATVRGIGKVTGWYEYYPESGFPHRRRVEWLNFDEWKLPEPAALLRSTVRELKRDPENRIEIERHVLEGSKPSLPPRHPEPSKHESTSAATSTSAAQEALSASAPQANPSRLTWTHGEQVGRIQDVLNRKNQVILYGPPGTGKTHWAERAAKELASLWNIGASFDQLAEADKQRVAGHAADGFVVTCCFHPGYGYEDFIEGYRPVSRNGTLHFELHDGLFKRLCQRAADDPGHRYYFIIDEINRGDIPRIFGELIALLDKPKRGTAMLLPASGKPFTVPANLYIIGTMNTADRSIALLDTALRRRFGFIELQPDITVLRNTVVASIPLGPWLASINSAIAKHVGRDGRNLQIGHSYLLTGGRPIQEFSQLARVLQEELLPLLEEYCYDDWTRLEQIAGSGLVDVSAQRFRSELFEPNRQDDLIQAIRASAPDISTSPIAVAADVDADAAESDEQDADDETEEVPT
jgi:5-methylcytosine-specific restriction protein B